MKSLAIVLLSLISCTACNSLDGRLSDRESNNLALYMHNAELCPGLLDGHLLDSVIYPNELKEMNICAIRAIAKKHGHNIKKIESNK